MSQFPSDVFAHAMRLVVPMRREFGKHIDVQTFLYDLTYAKEVLDLAVSSQNEKLKENAEYLGRMVFGLRELGLPLTEQRSMVGEKLKGALCIDEAVATGSPGAAFSESTEKAELLVGLTSKYIAGVR